jgi:mRNA-degrading endonuclease RelE of RelBE toxin-antitoxin system
MHSKERHTLVYPVWVFDPSDWLRFVHLRLFEGEWSDLKLGDDALRGLEVAILAGPDRHPVVAGTGGLRKIRFAEPGSNRGKSGSYRVGYVYFPDYHTILLVTVWGKNEKSDLSKADRNAIAGVIQEIKELLDRGGI